MKRKIKKWLYGLISTGVSSLATSLSVHILAPNEFNFIKGFSKILIIAGISAFISIANYIQKSPFDNYKD